MSREPVSWREVVEGWRCSADARLKLCERISEFGQQSLLWETSPSRSGREAYGEWLGDKPSLARRNTSARAFEGMLTDGVVSFPNLGGQSIMVCPPVTGDYGHLLSFVRNAPEPLLHQLWIEVAVQVVAWWADPERGVLWLSTHGGGVPWVHIRLDPHPKYYQSALRQYTV